MDKKLFLRNINFLLTKENRKESYLYRISELSKTTIWNYLRLESNSKPSIDFILTISEHFKVSCDDLLKVDLEKVSSFKMDSYDKPTDRNLTERVTFLEEEFTKLSKQCKS